MPRIHTPAIPTPVGETLAVIVVAGGRGARLGGTELGDKARYQVQGVPLVEHVVHSIPSESLSPWIVLVSPHIELSESAANRIAVWAMEDPPGAGPCAAVVAGVDAMRRHNGVEAEMVAMLAGDAPHAGQAISALALALSEQPQADAAALVVDGRLNYLVALWRVEALMSAVERIPSDGVHQPMSALYNGIVTIAVDDLDRVGADIDTVEDVHGDDMANG